MDAAVDPWEGSVTALVSRPLAPPARAIPRAQIDPRRLGAHPAADRAGPIDLGCAHRILAVRPDNLGDVVLLTPALRALRAAAPARARLDLLATPAGAAVGPLLDSVDEVVEVPSVSWQDAAGETFDPQAQLALIRRLAAGGYDLAVIFTSSSQSPWPAAFVCACAGIPIRAGASREFGGSLLTHWTDALPEGLHQADRALALLSRFGVPTDQADRRLELRLPPDASTAARRELGAFPAGAPYAVLLPGASCPSRRYPAHRFAVVAELLAGAGLRVVVAGTAREAELVEQVRAGADRTPSGPADPSSAGEASPSVGLAGSLTVPELAALLRGAAVVVTNNSGGAHLADAVRAPVVILFAGTEREAEYQPRAGTGTLLRRPTACSPCRAFVCAYQQECLDIPPAQVAAAALRLVPRRAIPSRPARGDRPGSARPGSAR